MFLLQIMYLQRGGYGSPVVGRTAKLGTLDPALGTVVEGTPLIGIVGQVEHPDKLRPQLIEIPSGEELLHPVLSHQGMASHILPTSETGRLSRGTIPYQERVDAKPCQVSSVIRITLPAGGELPSQGRCEINGTTAVLEVVYHDLTAPSGSIVVGYKMSVRHPNPKRAGEVGRGLTDPCESP